MKQNKNHPSLTPTVFHILLALSDKERHGYEIIKTIEQDTSGSVRLLTGTLYLALKRLLDANYIVEITKDKQDGRQRRYYKLSSGGKQALAAEIAIYQQRLAIVNKKESKNVKTQPAT
jgi:DNA-binding PadR family transcriptional regulator